jgi:hypothetical protein
MLKMDKTREPPANGEPVDNDGTYRQTTAADQQNIFYACRSTMVEGTTQRGIFNELANQLGFERKTVARQWHNMIASLSTLLSNHPGENEADVISRNHHILFQPAHSSCRGGKYKHDSEELIASLPASLVSSAAL